MSTAPVIDPAARTPLPIPGRPRRRFGLGAAAALVALVVLALAPLVLDQFTVFILNRVVVMGLFAVAFNIVFGYAGMSSLGHAALFGIGAYTVALGQVRAGWPPLLTLVLAAVVAGALGVIFGVLTIRTRGIYVLLLTVAAAQAVWGLVLQQVGITGGDSGVAGVRPPFELGRNGLYWLCLAITVVCLGLLRLFVVSPVGMALLGLRESESRMAALGYPAGPYRVVAFGVSGVFCGVAGAMYAWLFGSVNPQALHWPLSAAVMVYAILGGAGTFLGPLVGAGALIGLETWISTFTDRWNLAVGLAYMLTVLFLPGGLAHTVRRVRRWWQHRRQPEAAGDAVAAEPFDDDHTLDAFAALVATAETVPEIILARLPSPPADSATGSADSPSPATPSPAGAATAPADPPSPATSPRVDTATGPTGSSATGTADPSSPATPRPADAPTGPDRPHRPVTPVDGRLFGDPGEPHPPEGDRP